MMAARGRRSRSRSREAVDDAESKYDRADAGDERPSAHLCCPITCDVMFDPVSAADNRTYDRKAIAQWLVGHATSPVTGARLRDKVVRVNWSMRDTIEHAGFSVREAPREEEDLSLIHISEPTRPY